MPIRPIEAESGLTACTAMLARLEKTAKTSLRGNLLIGDHWNAITIIAWSQSNALKAVVERVENIGFPRSRE